MLPSGGLNWHVLRGIHARVHFVFGATSVSRPPLSPLRVACTFVCGLNICVCHELARRRSASTVLGHYGPLGPVGIPLAAFRLAAFSPRLLAAVPVRPTEPARHLRRSAALCRLGIGIRCTPLFDWPLPLCATWAP